MSAGNWNSAKGLKLIFNTDIHRRRSIRLKGYDYSPAGAYFITICAYGMEYLFGDIINGKITLNDPGIISQSCWREIPDHFPFVNLDEFVIMPNHIHGIIMIMKPGGTYVGANVGMYERPCGTSKTIGSIVRGYKIGVTKWFHQHTNIYNVWQRNYYEHIIRNNDELNRIRDYIINNPANWETDGMRRGA